MRIACFRC